MTETHWPAVWAFSPLCIKKKIRRIEISINRKSVLPMNSQNQTDTYLNKCGIMETKLSIHVCAYI